MMILGLSAAVGLSACNLTGFMDTPSGDIQLLDAARACLDRADYDCALEYYQQISVESDQKVSELSLTNLANANLFKMSDLIESLGSGTGGINSFAFMAETLASRGKTTGADRAIIQKAYADASTSINEPTLRAYIQFVASMAMMNQVLASAVGTDGQLTAADIASDPVACRNSNCGVGGGNDTDCDSNNNFRTVVPGAETEVNSNMELANNWSGSPTVKKALIAATAANTASIALFGSANNNGIGGVFYDIITEPNNGVTDQQIGCFQRKALLTVLFPNN